MTENIQTYTHKCMNYQVMKESKKELDYEKVQHQMKFMKAVSEVTEKMMMKFLHDEIYINYEILHKILTDNDVNLIEEVVRHFIQQHAVFKYSSFYLLYELHPRISENALKKMRKRTAVADTTVTDTAETAVINVAVAVADTAVVNAESRLKEISYAYIKANELLLN
ncbi:hypothetical protein BDBG_03900 [Blastomyces gilchristii SLH14081]|uniref:Uncharacterized protein n=1 Tax=Blastomyces gilchristii (strain SLH14081) TaxID=559298 RepID=A0A179ULJ9_BLAGS|nr:uncharacterized protein BDBG_03900 [Blastomyces gilchristii SLH14081]OAT07881.1 hypothetical protein BDBG_03900 [Blastomyces gilchristii SLH14081]